MLNPEGPLLFNFDYMNILDKLNLKKFLITIFKNDVLSKLISEVDDIQPTRIENIPEDVKIYKLYPNIIFVAEKSATEKYCNLISREYLEAEGIGWDDKEKLLEIADKLLIKDLDCGLCQLALEDIYYDIFYNNNNEWLISEENMTSHNYPKSTFDDLDI
jgi:hypothetical protein